MGPDQIRDAIDREVELVEGAIAMVASGASTAMTVAGLRFGEAVLKVVLRDHPGLAISITPLWRTDESGCDIRVTKPPHA